MTRPVITMCKVEGEELPFRVTIAPEPEGANLSGRFADHRAAFGYCVGMRMSIGGTVVDLSEDKDGSVAAMLGEIRNG